MNNTISFTILTDNLHGNYEYKQVVLPISKLYNVNQKSAQETYERNEELLDKYFTKYCRKHNCIYLELGNPEKYPDPNILLNE